MAAELAAKARELGQAPVAVLSLGQGNQTFALPEDVELLEGPADPPSPWGEDAAAAAIATIAQRRKAHLVLVGSTRRGKEIAGRLAALLDGSCATDVTELRIVEREFESERASLGGKTTVTERLHRRPVVVAALPHTFEAGATHPVSAGQPVADLVAAPTQVTVLKRTPKPAGGAGLAQASMVVGIGKGLKREADLALVQEFAQALGAEIGCTRPLATDRHWLTEDRVIGLSYLKLKPDLYVAIGISGQIQHTVGILKAKTIVTINANKDEPMFALSDYGLVGDLYRALPLLTARLRGG